MGMENKFFNWENWDTSSEFEVLFFPVTLKMDLGPHKAGDVCFGACINFQAGTLRIYDENGKNTFIANLELSLKG
jgi:hypothetical protein